MQITVAIITSSCWSYTQLEMFSQRSALALFCFQLVPNFGSRWCLVEDQPERNPEWPRERSAAAAGNPVGAKSEVPLLT